MKICARRFAVAALVWMVATVIGPSAFAQDNLRDGAPFNGYTGVPFDTTGYHYDYLVDSSLPQDDPANRKFKTLQAAYAAAPAGTPDHPTVIGIKPDVYLLHVGPDAPYSIQVTKDNITFLGLTDDRRKVVLADNRGNKEGATNNGYIFDVNANGFSMINLTVCDYANLDYEYPGDPSKNLHKRSDVITQAVAIQMQGDRHVYSHIAFLSRLDTTFIRTTRSYWTNVFVEGTDDFLGGGTVGVFKDSAIYFPTGRGVMSASNLTFINTVFKAARGLEFYKGFGNPDTLIDCVMPADTPESPTTWMAWDQTPAHQNLFSLTYHVKDANGKPLRIRDKMSGPPTYTLSRELSDEEVKAFNPWNLLRAALPNGPTDDWDPAGVRTKYEADGSDVFRMAVSGPPPTGGVAGGGPFVSRAVSPTVRTGSTEVTITANLLPVRAKDTPVTWSTDSNLVTLTPAANKATISGNNKTNHAEYVVVKAKAANGFFVDLHVYVEPAFIDPPKFVRTPEIAAPANGKVEVHYALDLGGRDDQSLITWYQCDDASCANPRKVAVSRGDQPDRSYTLTAGDVGKVLRVSIQPKHNISDPGPEVVAVGAKPITAANVTSTTINPDFRNFVAAENPANTNGEWTVVGTWTPVTGATLVNGYGLRVSGLFGAPPARGFGGGAAPEPPTDPNAPRVPNPYAALIYNNPTPTGDMQMKVVMSPEKTAGQGFGIAGSPDDIPRVERADIFIKYDPVTKNGYSLRFWRTIQSAEKCMFQLYKIENGVGKPIDQQQQLTGVFKPNTTIMLSIIGSKFTATGSNTMDGEKLALEGTITPNTFGSGGVYWSGSVPVGNSNVYSQIELSYPGRQR